MSLDALQFAVYELVGTRNNLELRDAGLKGDATDTRAQAVHQLAAEPGGKAGQRQTRRGQDDAQPALVGAPREQRAHHEPQADGVERGVNETNPTRLVTGVGPIGETRQRGRY